MFTGCLIITELAGNDHGKSSYQNEVSCGENARKCRKNLETPIGLSLSHPNKFTDDELGSGGRDNEALNNVT